MMPLKFAQTLVEQALIRANMTLVLQPDSDPQADGDIAERILSLEGKIKVIGSMVSRS